MTVFITFQSTKRFFKVKYLFKNSLKYTFLILLVQLNLIHPVSKTARKQRRRRKQLLDLILERTKILIRLNIIPRTLMVGRNILSKYSRLLAVEDALT